QDRRIEVDDLIQNLMQQKRRAALAKHRTRAEQLLYIVDAAERIVMISNHVVRAEEGIELDGVEVIGTGVRAHAMNDEVEVPRKFLDLRIVSRLAAVLDRQRVKMKYVE